MKKLIVLLAFLTLVNLGMFTLHSVPSVYAQVSVPPFWFSVGPSTHTSCQVTPSATSYCFAADGLWQSLNGGAWSQVGAGVGNVTSVNGQTGVVNINYANLGPVPIKNSFLCPAATATGTIAATPSGSLSLTNFSTSGCQ